MLGLYGDGAFGDWILKNSGAQNKTGETLWTVESRPETTGRAGINFRQAAGGGVWSGRLDAKVTLVLALEK